MKKNSSKIWVYYSILLVVFSVISVIFIKNGQALDHLLAMGKNILPKPELSDTNSFSVFKNDISENLKEPAGLLLLQLISILAVSRLIGFVFIKLKQPTVIGEILAGIMLGPSLLGAIFPDTFHFLFNPSSLNYLYILSQIGLILFMFTIGMDLNIDELKENLKDTFVISHSSILLPFLLGIILAYFVYGQFSTPESNFLSFSLFIGISMSITAFPVLARIIQEKGLTKTHLGTLTIASAANNDVTAWILLVAVIAIAQTGSFFSSVYTLAFSALYILIMLLVVRPFLKKIGDIYKNEELLNKSIFAFFILILIISSYFTELLGIHALFGAFLAGVIMPPLPKFRKIMIDKIEDISVSLLLPLFFVYTGLRTQIGLVNTPELWILTMLFIFIATFGKIFGSALPARIAGENWKNSLSLGVLMNTRGLMELIVLNIGLEMKILSPTMFVILVIVALVTTFMTSPLFELIEKIFPETAKQIQISKDHALGVFRTMIAMGNPENGNSLLDVAKTVLVGSSNSLSVNILHITAGTDTNPILSEQFAVQSFVKIKAAAESMKMPISTEYKVSDDIVGEIIHKTNDEQYDFLLIGAGQGLIKTTFIDEAHFLNKIKWLNNLIDKFPINRTMFYPGTVIKDKTKHFIEQTNCSVGVFVNRNFTKISSILIILSENTDIFLLRYAKRMLRNNSNITIQVQELNNLFNFAPEIFQLYQGLEMEFKTRISLNKISKLQASIMKKSSLLMISYQSWEELLKNENRILQEIPSTLIINKKTSRFNKEFEVNIN